MNFDQFQILWSRQPAPAAPDGRASTETLKRVRAASRAFDRTIFWRDARECFAAVIVSCVFGRMAWVKTLAGEPAWAYWSATALPLTVVAFLLLDRRRHKHLRPLPWEPVTAEVDRAIARLRHQEWLLRHVTWWYLLPLTLAGLIPVADTLLSMQGPWWLQAFAVLCLLALFIAMDSWIYRLNLRVIKTHIHPEIVSLETTRREFTTDVELKL